MAAAAGAAADGSEEVFLLRTQVSKLQLHVGHLMEEISTRDQEIHDRDMEIQARDESIAQLREENSRLAAAAQHAAQLQQHQQHVAYAQPAPAVQCFSISPTSQHPTHHPMASSSGGYASPRAAHPAPAAQPMSPMAMQGVQEEIKCLQLKLELVRNQLQYDARRGAMGSPGSPGGDVRHLVEELNDLARSPARCFSRSPHAAPYPRWSPGAHATKTKRRAGKAAHGSNASARLRQERALTRLHMGVPSKF